MKPEMIMMLKVYAHYFTERMIYAYSKLKPEKQIINPIYKRKTVENYAREYGCTVLVETGSYLGEMLAYQKNNFEKLYSVEISKQYYEFCKKRFSKCRNIKIILGDSGKILRKLISKIEEKEKVLYWLDGHYSGGTTGKGDVLCPILNEVESILNNKKSCVILIDDAREFIGENDYPSIDDLKKFIINLNGKVSFEVKKDIIRVIV